jgi:hypothetical protein
MRLKSLVVSLAALSVSAAAMAGQQQAQPKPVKSHHALIHALESHSYEASVAHNYLNRKMNGFWVGAYGQISGAYNTDYLLVHNTYQPNFGKPQTTTVTFSLDNADMLVGFDSNHAGFFADAGYSRFAAYDKADKSAKTIALEGNSLDLREAFMTYQFTSNVALKAGKFNSDFGSYDPYQPLQTQASALFAQQPVTGVEGVIAMDQFHASIAGAAQNDSQGTAGTKIPNAARPNIVIFNAGYGIHSKFGQLDLDASYTNMSPYALAKETKKVPAWLLGGHFATQSYSISAHVQSLSYPTVTYKPWLYDANFNYILTNKTSVGAYGDFVYNPRENIDSTHWLLGFTGAYKINHYLTANVYAQRVQVTTLAKASGEDDNVTVMGALSVKV